MGAFLILALTTWIVEISSSKTGNEFRENVHKISPSMGLIFGVCNVLKRTNYDVEATSSLLDHTYLSAFFVECNSHEDETRTEHILFEEYAGPLFQKLRSYLFLDNEKYISSFSNSHELISFKPNSKSLQKFFLTTDGRFLIKSMSREELAFFLDLLPYYSKFVESNEDSLLTRFVGLYRVGLPSGHFETFLVSTNIFYNRGRSILLEKYDLKGSKVGRRTLKKSATVTNDSHILKDLDLVESKRKFRIGLREKSKLMNVLAKDVAFLENHNIMDYSLLVGINSFNSTEKSKKLDHATHQLCFVQWPKDVFREENSYRKDGICWNFHRVKTLQPKSNILNLGLIDILQQYTFRKNVETISKSLLYGRGDISAVPPNIYSKRLLKFIDIIFE